MEEASKKEREIVERLEPLKEHLQQIIKAHASVCITARAFSEITLEECQNKIALLESEYEKVIGAIHLIFEFYRTYYINAPTIIKREKK